MANKKSGTDQILRDHRSCMQVLTEVEDCLKRLPKAVQNSEILARLRALDGTLRPHFTAEEEGIFLELPIDHPHLSQRFKKLAEEHGTILESLQAAISEAERIGDKTDQLLELRSQVQLLAVKLRRHEAEENELLMEAHWNTFGVSD